MGFVFIPLCNCFCCWIFYVVSVDGHLYNWGRGFSGSPDFHFPQFSSSSLLFTRAALGWNHALALTGMYIHFLLIISPFLHISYILNINLWHFKKVMQKFLCLVATTMESLVTLKKGDQQTNYLVRHLFSWEHLIILGIGYHSTCPINRLVNGEVAAIL